MTDINGHIIKPDWPAAENIHAFCTTRKNGVSTGVYAGNNLGLHVEDNPQHVLANRQQMIRQFNLPEEPRWLDQVHGNRVINANYIYPGSLSGQKDNNQLTQTDGLLADASFSETANTVCAVMTADCLPMLICNRKGNKVAAAHVGWRGLADDVIEATVASLSERHSELLIWLGPAIGAHAFEVGEEVFNIFVNNQPKAIEAFKQNRQGHYLADIYLLAKLRLHNIGIREIYGGEYCTYTDADQFYSYRRDGKTGRQASLIWFE
ncbi:MAG: peptidoglycan editing factor PgeF [Gammaproteobacteria bacterium]|nr:peptidoglycan editing factor PgeF [Gammaproteobacteria bacterium]